MTDDLAARRALKAERAAARPEREKAAFLLLLDETGEIPHAADVEARADRLAAEETP